MFLSSIGVRSLRVFSLTASHIHQVIVKLLISISNGNRRRCHIGSLQYLYLLVLEKDCRLGGGHSSVVIPVGQIGCNRVYHRVARLYCTARIR